MERVIKIKEEKVFSVEEFLELFENEAKAYIKKKFEDFLRISAYDYTFDDRSFKLVVLDLAKNKYIHNQKKIKKIFYDFLLSFVSPLIQRINEKLPFPIKLTKEDVEAEEKEEKQENVQENIKIDIVIDFDFDNWYIYKKALTLVPTSSPKINIEFERFFKSIKNEFFIAGYSTPQNSVPLQIFEEVKEEYKKIILQRINFLVKNGISIEAK